VFRAKNGFHLQNLRNLGVVVKFFLDKTPKSTYLADSMHFEPMIMQICSRVFFSRRVHEKKDTTNVTERLYFTYLRGITHPTKFN